MHPPILLASSSPYRAKLLETLGLAFIQVAPDIDESPLKGEDASSLAYRLSEQKALVLQDDYPEYIIIASDQVALSDSGKLLGKPYSSDAACEQLKLLSATKATFFTGLSVLSPLSFGNAYAKQSIVESFIVHFRTLSEQQISAYVEKEQPLNCAGSFKSEGLGIALFEQLEGDDPNTLIGLPLIKLCTLLSNISLDVLLNQKTNMKQ